MSGDPKLAARWKRVLLKSSATAKVKGIRARKLGLMETHCPYGRGPRPLREAWLEGWRETDQEVARGTPIGRIVEAC